MVQKAKAEYLSIRDQFLAAWAEAAQPSYSDQLAQMAKRLQAAADDTNKHRSPDMKLVMFTDYDDDEEVWINPDYVVKVRGANDFDGETGFTMLRLIDDNEARVTESVMDVVVKLTGAAD